MSLRRWVWASTDAPERGQPMELREWFQIPTRRAGRYQTKPALWRRLLAWLW